MAKGTDRQANFGGSGLIPRVLRPGWYRMVALTFGSEATLFVSDPRRKVYVTITLPNGKKVRLEPIPLTATVDDLLQIAGDKFKEVWDPQEWRRRTT